MSRHQLFKPEPAPSPTAAPAARHLAVGDLVYHTGADFVGVLVSLGLRESQVSLGETGSIYVCDTENIRHATEAEIARFDDRG